MSAPAAARKEGRLYEGHDVMKVEQAGDQCTLGCNFDTKRPLRDILAIYKAVLGHGFSPRAMQDGDCALPSMLDRSIRRCEPPDGDMRKSLGGDSVHRIMHPCRRFASRSRRPSRLMTLYMAVLEARDQCD